MQTVISIVEAGWTRYRLVTPAGEGRRLLKLAADAQGVSRFRLLALDGRQVGEAIVPPETDGAWHFGFWVAEADALADRYLGGAGLCPAAGRRGG